MHPISGSIFLALGILPEGGVLGWVPKTPQNIGYKAPFSGVKSSKAYLSDGLIAVRPRLTPIDIEALGRENLAEIGPEVFGGRQNEEGGSSAE